MHEIADIGFDHLAAHHRRAENEDVRGVEKLLAAHILARALEHGAGVADEIDHQSLTDDRALDGEGRVVEASVEGIDDGLLGR